MIRIATLEDIDRILEITQSCADKMISDGIYQWNESYPTRESFNKDVGRGELYVLETDQTVMGLIVISSYKDKVYEEIEWLTKDTQHFYIHRLAVEARKQGLGFAQKLMDFAETKAKNEGITSVRLDTFSQNKRNQKFYRKRGYSQLGDIYFPKQSDQPFYCYELVF